MAGVRGQSWLRSGPRGWVSRAGFFVAVAIGLWLLGRVLQANAGALADLAARGPDWRFVVLGVACYLATQLITMARWALLAAAAGVPVRAWDAFALGVAGETGNLVMPGANGGDAIKLGLIVRSGRPVTRLVASTVADRIAGLLGLLGIGLIAGMVQWSQGSATVRSLTMLLGGFVAVTAAVVMMMLRPLVVEFIEARCRRWPAAMSVVGQFAAVADAYRSKYGTLLGAVAMSVVSQCFTLGALYCSGVAMSRSLAPTLAATLVGGPLVLVSTALPLPFGAIGVTEEVGERLFHVLGYSGGGLAMLGYRGCHSLAVLALATGYWAAQLFVRRPREECPHPDPPSSHATIGTSPSPATDIATQHDSTR